MKPLGLRKLAVYESAVARMKLAHPSTHSYVWEHYLKLESESRYGKSDAAAQLRTAFVDGGVLLLDWMFQFGDVWLVNKTLDG